MTLLINGGSMPSRLIANRILVCPYSVTRVTEKMEMIAPAAMTVPGHDEPTTFCRICASPASCSSKSCHGCAPTAPSATDR